LTDNLCHARLHHNYRGFAMHEHRYDPSTIKQPYRSLFEQLALAFPDHDLWQRHENFGRWLSAGVVENGSGAMITIRIIHANTRRTWPFHKSDLDLFRRSLSVQRTALVATGEASLKVQGLPALSSKRIPTSC
jgi:hypothetical protein